MMNKMNWIKKGIKKELKELSKVQNILLIGGAIGIPSILSLFIPINLRFLGTIYLKER